MKLLITGGCGFIGSNFINYFASKFPKTFIVNLDAMYYCASEENVTIRDSNNYKFIKGNLQSKDLVSHILKEYSITLNTVSHHFSRRFNCSINLL